MVNRKLKKNHSHLLGNGITIHNHNNFKETNLRDRCGSQLRKINPRKVFFIVSELPEIML